VKLPLLPAWVSLFGGWGATVHYFGWPSNELDDSYGPFEVLVLSKDDESGVARLHEIRFLGAGGSGLVAPKEYPGVFRAEDAWLANLVETRRSNSAVDPGGLYEVFSKDVQRRLLTGHVVALRFYPVLMARQLLRSTEVHEPALQVMMKSPTETITEATARLYYELTQWGETSAASVIAKLEGTSVVTIRNRLHAARQKGLLDKPGSGVRRL
jgi:hypothetical protein